MASTFQTTIFAPMRRVFVFSIWTRVYHWLNALTIVILSITGYIIGNPPAFMIAEEASFSYWFGYVRFIHFATAFIFFFNFLVRLYFGWAGNRFERWNNFIPYKKAAWEEIWHVIKIDVLLMKGKPMVSIGHNALAGFSYFILFILFLAQCATGFALYADMSTSWVAGLFTWVTPLLGGDMLVRNIHHILMWGFIVFTVVHVYLVFYHDYVEGRGEVSSMFGGWKFIEKDCVDEKECTDFNR